MDKFKINYDALMQELVPDPNRMPLAGNEHRIVRVAFDLFRLKDGDPEELWQVQSSDDGEYLVRTFSLPEEEKVAESSDWTVEIDRKEANLTVAYKQVPLTRIAARDYGANTPEDARLLRRVVHKKLATDIEFGKKLINSLPIEKQQALYVFAKESPYVGAIEQQTEKNKNFRKVLFTGDHSQLVLMSVEPGEELGSEVHKAVDQFFRIEEGEATFVLDGKKKRVKAGGGVVIPAGTEHNVINSSKTEPLKLYTIYSPPNHPPGTVQKTKEDAEKAEEKEQKADDQWKLAFAGLNPIKQKFLNLWNKLNDVDRKYLHGEVMSLSQKGQLNPQTLEQLMQKYQGYAVVQSPKLKDIKVVTLPPAHSPGQQKADDQWRLAFFDLGLHKTSGLFEEEQEEYEKMLAGTPAEEEWFESETALTEGLEDQDTLKDHAVTEAYYMIEHDLEPGSSEAAELSELAWEVESGKKDYKELEALMERLKGLEADDEPSDYSDYFMKKCKEYAINPHDIPALSEEQRKAFFEDVDAGWKAKNECIDPLTQRQMLETGLGPVLKKRESGLLISKRAQKVS